MATYLEAAKVAAADHMVAVGMGADDVPAPVSIRQARAALNDVMDEAEATTAARDALAKQLKAVEASPGFATDRLRDAALAVVRTEAADHARAVAEKVAALQRDLIACGTELRWLAGAGVFPWSEETGSHRYHRVTDPDVAAALNRMESPPSTWNELHRIPELQAHVRWAEAMDKLAQDPNASLPVK